MTNTPKHEATDAMGMESQSVDHETEAFKVLQVIEQRAWALGDDQYARLAKEAKDHLSRATTQPAEQSGSRLPTVAPNTERLRADAANFMQHNTDDHCRRMCRVGVDDLAVLLAWVAQFPTLGEAK